MAPDLVEIGELWAAMIERFEFDPRSKTCEMRMSVLDGSRTTNHTLTASGIRRLRFFNDYQGPGEVLEATEVFINHEDEDSRLTIQFWGPDAGLEVVARTFSLNGSPLDPSSRDIPRRTLTER